jgi:uncharacterized membrane protein YadS
MTVISSTKLAKSLHGRAGTRLPSTIQRWPGRNSHEILPGLFLNWVVAGTAFVIRQLPGMATFSPMILSLVIAIAFHHIVGTVAWAKQSTTFGSRWLPGIAASTAIGAGAVTNVGDEEVACAIACVRVFGSVAIFAHQVPTDAHAWIVAAAAFLSIALAAIGLETNIGKLTAKSFWPVMLGALAFLLIPRFSLPLIKLMEYTL